MMEAQLTNNTLHIKVCDTSHSFELNQTDLVSI